MVLRVDLSLNSGDVGGVVQWLHHRMIEECEKVVFPSDAHDWDDYMGKMFFDDYIRWTSGTMSHLYQQDKTAFKIEFGRHIEKIRETQMHEYIKRLIRYITKSNKKIPCLVFDNTDHFTIQFQEAVFQYARSLYESEFCVVIVPITDKTSWQLSKQGALQSFESEALFLPVPHSKRVIERRVAFLLEKSQDEDHERRGTYFLSRGIRLKVEDIAGFAASLNRVFVESKDTARWIGGLANHDIRRMLELTKDVIASPHLKLDDLLKAHVAGESEVIAEHRIKQAIIKRRYDIYPVGEHSFVQNLFSMSLEPPTTPLLGVRILQFLRDATETPDQHEHEFVPVDAVHEHFTALGVHPTVTQSWLAPMLHTGLILNYDPSVMEVDRGASVEVSPSGTIHLAWATMDRDYLQMMRDVTPLRDKAVYDVIVNGYTNYRQKWAQSLKAFIEYLLSEDGIWCRVPDHSSFAGQVSVTKRLERLVRQLR